ncbi:MAG: choice-of-anchor J domain-containing protein, partial [Candidatus Cloacimonadaceae bacterium]|nr:choice-of-anchor J domain-containing protein [Candidatus Cloacimonadaceae bacterium]
MKKSILTYLFLMALLGSTSLVLAQTTALGYTFTPPGSRTVPNPASPVSPVNGGWVVSTQTLNWMSNGDLPDSYDVYFGTTPNPPFIRNQTATTYAPVLSPGTTYYWKIVPRNENGSAENCPVWSFHTASETQLFESFEGSSWPPLGWLSQGSFTKVSNSSFHGVSSAYTYTSTSAVNKLVTPILNISPGSVLDFYCRTATTNGAQRIQIQYSADGTTWTPFGEEIALPTVTTWQHYQIDLSPLAQGNPNYYLAFAVRATTAPGAVYIDHIIGPDYAPVVPNQVTLIAPADAAVNLNEYPILSWTPGLGGGIPTGYKIYIDENPNPTTLLDTATASPYAVTTLLNENTIYYWKVVATNAAGDAEASAVRSFTVRAYTNICSFPWLVDFDTSPSNWMPTGWSQLWGRYPTPTGPSSQWVQDDWLNITNPVNKAAKINIYGTNRFGWLITPPITIPSPHYNLKFDAALMVWNSISTPVTPGNQVDEKFILVMSDTANMTNPTILREWNNTGSVWVFDNIP